MPFPRRLFLACLLALIPVSATAVQDAAITALGRTVLVMEEDATRLTLFNGGNPAGLALLPDPNRLDVTVYAFQRERRAEFSPGLAYDPNPARPEFEKDRSTLDPHGNTLVPESIVTRQRRSLSFGLTGSDIGGYGVIIARLAEGWTLQSDRHSRVEEAWSTQYTGRDWDASGGGRLRAAVKAFPGLAFGAGFGFSDRHAKYHTSPDLSAETATSMYPYDTLLALRSQGLTAETGAALRLPSVFEEDDYLDLGVTLNAAREETRADAWIPSTAFGVEPSARHDLVRDEPWRARFQGVYQYEGRMDVGLTLDYLEDRVFRSLATTSEETPEYLASRRRDWDYEIGIRLRIPMVREEDLRFGVTFSNQAEGHFYPTGRTQDYAPDGRPDGPPMDTLASSIGIGTAFVPGPGSLIALEYRLGSTKSREGSVQVAKSGFSRFGFGAQYALFKRFFLRLGFSNRLVDHEINQEIGGEIVLLRRSEEIQDYTLGLGLEEGPWRIDAAATFERVLHSPLGWTMRDKPDAIDAYGEGAEDWDAVNQDKTERIVGRVTLSLRF